VEWLGKRCSFMENCRLWGIGSWIFLKRRAFFDVFQEKVQMTTGKKRRFCGQFLGNPEKYFFDLWGKSVNLQKKGYFGRIVGVDLGKWGVFGGKSADDHGEKETLCGKVQMATEKRRRFMEKCR